MHRSPHRPSHRPPHRPPRRSRRRAAWAVVALALLASVTAACTAGGYTPPAGISCAWPNKTTKETLNVAYPDSGATYWSMQYNLLAGDRVIIEGSFPETRYISFITYNLAGNVVDAVTDRDIVPTAGGQNPFADPAAPTGDGYRLEVRSDIGPGVNDNLLASGGVTGTIIYRTYVSDVAGDPTGGEGLPAVSVRKADGTVVAVPTCAAPGGDGGLIDIINAFGPPTDVPAEEPPVFKRPANVGGLYANPDNGYVAAVADHSAGSVVVVRGKAPTTPDTEAGDSPAEPGNDMRYWSMCTNEYRKPYPVTDCAYDAQVPLDAGGYYTIVTSTAADRPANATVADGVAWLDWGSTAQDMLLILRNMLPDPAFGEDVFEVAPGQPASTAMGDHAPVTTRCSTATFEAGGAAACGLP